MSTLRVSAINNEAAGSGGLAISATGNVTGSGMDLIVSQSFTTVSTVSVDNCFTSAYSNYRVVLTCTKSALTAVNFRTRAAAADETSANYSYQQMNVDGAGVTGSRSTAATYGDVMYSDTGLAALTVEIQSPQVATHTLATFHSASSYNTLSERWIAVRVGTSSQYDGFTLYPASGTFTGTIRVYGYRN